MHHGNKGSSPLQTAAAAKMESLCSSDFLFQAQLLSPIPADTHHSCPELTCTSLSLPSLLKVSWVFVGLVHTSKCSGPVCSFMNVTRTCHVVQTLSRERRERDLPVSSAQRFFSLNVLKPERLKQNSDLHL